MGAGDRRVFWKIAGAGATFQAGSSSVDSATIVASLVFQMTGSAFAVGAASAILRLGWLLPQLVVGYLAQRSPRRMPYYAFGAFGRATCLALIALLLWFSGASPGPTLAAAFLVLWTVYAFVSGIVAVPYNDIVGRAIRPDRRSRLLAWRFFGGGMLALAAAAVIHQVLDRAPSFAGYALVFAGAAALMVVSSTLFVSAGEPPNGNRQSREGQTTGVGAFLREGWSVIRSDRPFRLFLYSQWLGGFALMALPFYVVSAMRFDIGAADVATLLGAQTVGAIASNPLWGRIGDGLGKLRLLQAVALLRAAVPLGLLLLLVADPPEVLLWFVGLFFLLGALVNGTTISYLGYLMEVSPDDRRPAYSAYFNVMASPAALLPLAGAALINIVSLQAVFWVAAIAALAQFDLFRRLMRTDLLGARR